MSETKLLNWKIIEKKTGIKAVRVNKLDIIIDKAGDWLAIEYEEVEEND